MRSVDGGARLTDKIRPHDDDVVLSVRGLRTEFASREGAVQAVRDVSLDLRTGEKLGIVGESGSGKSALALSILGLIEPPGRIVGGEVLLGGRDLRALPERRLLAVRGGEISLVFQDSMTALDPVKTIGSQIVETIGRHQRIGRRAARRLAVELLRDVEVPFAERRLDDYPHQYSGGMRQRVMIAIALANQPKVVIADEPTTALDVTTQAQVLDVLDRLVSERGVAVILITHNLGVVAEFCDEIRVMYAGRFVEEATAQDLFRQPLHPYTTALLRAIPRPDVRVRSPLVTIPGLPPALADLPPGCSFEPRCSLGHGRERCANEPPLPRKLDPAGARSRVECHFAEEMIGQIRTGVGP